MIFLDLHISGFGRFADYDRSFGPGANILYGKNEAGKTTLHTFLRAMLYGLSDRPGKGGKKSPREACRPWTGTAYGGTLRFLHEGKTFRIERDFNQPDDALSVVCEDTGQLAVKPQELIASALLGLTETGYINTISIGQLKAGPGKGMAESLSRYYGNLSSTGDADLDAQRALAYLARRRAELEERMCPNAEKNYASVIGRIKNLEEMLRDPANNNDLIAYQELRDSLRRSVSEKEEEQASLSARIEKKQKVLEGAGFSDKKDLETLRTRAESLFREYHAALEKIGNIRLTYGTVLPAVCILLAIAASAGTIVFPRSRIVPLAAAAAGFLVLAFFLRRRSDAAGKNCSMLGESLGNILRRYTGNDETDEHTMQVFRDGLDGYQRLWDETEALREESRRVQEERLEFSKKLSACAEDIENQQNVRLLVEQRLVELNSLKNQAQELRYETAENARLAEECDAMDLAAEKITELSESIGKSLGTYLNREAGELISKFTGGAYHGIEAGNGTFVYLHTSDRMVSVTEVSSGTMDQVWLALRLAAVRLVQGSRNELPILFDDSFALYDDDRMKNALKTLLELYPGQLLIFSCHRREAEALREDGISFRFLEV